MLVDDPQAIAPGRDDEAIVNLAQRPQIRKDGQALRSFRGMRQWAVRVRNRLRSDALEIEPRIRRCSGFQMKYGKMFYALRGNTGVGHRLELLILDSLREVGIGQRGRRLRRQRNWQAGSGSRGYQTLP